MSASLADYRAIVGPEIIDELKVAADQIKHRRLQHINSTLVGGGVAELLDRMVPLFRELGVETSWDVIKGEATFFEVTKAFHNALHGGTETITEAMLETYRETTAQNLQSVAITGDVVVVHDPQPAGLIEQRGDDRRWIWRCHIDVSTPDPKVWGFLKSYVDRYDSSVFSMPEFSQQLQIPQFMITPSIDPLSDKNRELPQETIERTLEQYGLDPERPILTQISRFDRLKDPVGVIKAYRLVKRRHDCQLVLAGGAADDDPEGAEVLKEVNEAADGDADIHVVALPPHSDIEINALVRGSTIVLQKSIKEGFGLTVTEALWKRKAVIAGAVGGIKLQILNGITGFLVHSSEGAANRAIELLGDPELRQRLGTNGYLHAKENFLTTRHIRDYLLMILALEEPSKDMRYLVGLP
ncbi:MAG: glycosyltransferase [Vicinamibacterales bacterium]|nr:glycosyltransferase [Vicinamibacterales bacterium]MDP7670320.1 glycosyltransferase [Vicinamibacterales bacterium]HJO37977.1 glycosyltransferase [Vicinamibacterales bacterium]